MPCYCYEHNLLFKHALEALGFRVKDLLARALDVGFGGVTLTGPLRLIADIEQTRRTNPSTCIEWTTNLSKKVKIHDAWVPLYRFGHLDSSS